MHAPVMILIGYLVLTIPGLYLTIKALRENIKDVEAQLLLGINGLYHATATHAVARERQRCIKHLIIVLAPIIAFALWRDGLGRDATLVLLGGYFAVDLLLTNDSRCELKWRTMLRQLREHK